MLDNLTNEAKACMEKAIDALRDHYKRVRTGRASVGILDGIRVEAYGNKMPLNQLANLSTPDAKTIMIEPWDKTILQAVEKEIQKSDLGLNPSNDGSFIRLNVPALTEDRRKEFVKVIKQRAEDAKISIRNGRRDINDQIKALEKNSEISKDDAKKGLDDVQKLTDKYVKEVDSISANKEKELMEL